MSLLRSRLGLLFSIGFALAFSSGEARAAPCSAGLLTGSAALLSDWSDDRPGLCRRLLPDGLAQPGRSNSSFSTIVSVPPNLLPKVPPGFAVRRFHEGAEQPRLIRTAPNGDIFVAESRAGQIRVLRTSGICQLGATALFASGLDLPFGIAFYPPGPDPTHVYVAESSRVVRFRYEHGDLVASGEPEVVVPDLPQGAGDLPGRGHWTRDVVFSPDGRRMFVAVGSYSNVQQRGEDETERAAILEFRPDGSGRQVFASGLRNPVSLSISPETGTLWATVNERDGLGDELVPDFVTGVKRGQFYGWPWFYIGDHADPRPATSPPANLPPVTVPRVLLQAHSASLGAAFYTGTQFPAEYRGNLFVALHGSWNRANPVGSKVIRIVFDEQGWAFRYHEDFMTGFVLSNHDVWGRPVGVAVGTGGSLYVSEDARRTIYCVNYTR
jgi:glucose/arabinose dehydrogenase